MGFNPTLISNIAENLFSYSVDVNFRYEYNVKEKEKKGLDFHNFPKIKNISQFVSKI